MRTYIIGDVQGCFDSLLRLLDKLKFDHNKDYLWFCGDLVNRGPKSLQALNYIKDLDLKNNAANTILGNHDLHLIACYYNNKFIKSEDNFTDILDNKDADKYISYLLTKPLFFYNKQDNYCVSHAGVNPFWDLNLAISCNQEYLDFINNLLVNNSHDELKDFFDNLYGNQPDLWDNNLKGYDKYRIIINSFTRMRFVDSNNKLLLDYKGEINTAPEDHIPWFLTKDHKLIQQNKDLKIFFGHWAALRGKTNIENIIGLDTGCVYGGALTAYCIEDNKKISV